MFSFSLFLSILQEMYTAWLKKICHHLYLYISVEVMVSDLWDVQERTHLLKIHATVIVDKCYHIAVMPQKM